MTSQQQKSVAYSFYPIQPPITIYSKSSQQSQPVIRTIKMIRFNQNAEQKTQYLETILRMSQQQKSNSNSSAFDRIRFANQSNVSTDKPIENTNQTNSQTDCDEDIIIESTVPKSSGLQSWAGFLIDGCDEVESSPVSHSNIIQPTTSPTKAASDNKTREECNQTQNDVLLEELNAAHLEQKQELKRKKRIRKTFQRKKSFIDRQTKTKKHKKSYQYKNISIESPSDWIVEHNPTENSNDQLSQLIDTVRKTSTTVNDADKCVQINLLLEQIKKQQLQLKKLSQYVSSMLDSREQTDDIQHNNNNNQSQHLLTNFLNQPLTTGCWLCSGKTYTEVAIQCDSINIE